MSAIRILVLYEYSHSTLPHGSAYIRLIQPLSHHTISGRFTYTATPLYCGQKADLVIIDRHWRTEMGLDTAVALVRQIRANGARLSYQIDDDLLGLSDNADEAHARREGVRYFLQHADGVIVSTPTLRQRFAPFNPQIRVIKNALDERLLTSFGGSSIPRLANPDVIVLGYMGTFTHEDDLRMILSALAGLVHRTTHPLELQIIGGADQDDFWRQLQALPFPVRRIVPPSPEYPQFLSWFTANVTWDIALAPLRDTPFNRAKSDIKFLDYAALGAAGVYSDLPVYAETVRHGETGLLAANDAQSWAAAIQSLIEQPGLRVELAANARRYLYNERILARRAGEWVDALESILQG